MEKPQGKVKKACLIILAICLICFAFLFFPLVWIPAIIVTIIFAIKKGPNKKRNLLISSIICVASFFVFNTEPSQSPELSSLKVDWNDSEYDIEETAEVTLSPVPEDAKIESLSISDNSIATLEYKDGKAIVSFIAEGSDDLYFIANDKIKSNKKPISVIDAKAEAERKAEEERLAAEQAEAERIAQEQAEAERIAAEQAEAEKAAQAQSAENNFNTYNNPEQQQTTSSYVLNTSTMKFHSPGCRDVSKIAPQNYSTFDGTRENVINQGYSPCGHCNP